MEKVNAVTDKGPLTIACRHSIKRRAAVMCAHLLATDEPTIGFVENSSNPDDLQTWCTACETFFIREGEMSDAFKAFNDMKVVCDVCYSERKAKRANSPS